MKYFGKKKLFKGFILFNYRLTIDLAIKNLFNVFSLLDI
jgi:hypothetical protein